MAQIGRLSDIITDKNRIVFSDDIEKKYLSDALGRKSGRAAALVFPVSTQEVSDVVRFAFENGIPLTPRGAGTNLVGSTVPRDGAIVLDFSRMNRILEIDAENLTAWVEPGVILEDFQAYVEERGLFYPPDPGEKRSSIGGNIATNAGGMRAVKYGVTRDYVMALEFVRADGTVITVGSKNRKDTTALDLKDLLVGSEGTLGIITKCLLRLVGKPERSLSLLAGFPSLKAGIGSVFGILRANLNPTALEFIERKVVRLGEDFLGAKFPADDEAYLLLTFDGGADEIDSAVRRLGTLLDGVAGRIIPLDDPALSRDVWRIRGCLVKAVEAVSEQEPLDIVVPISRVADFVAFVNALERESGMQMISFGHAGDGNVHLCVVRGSRSDADWERELHENLTRLYGEAQRMGGLISGEHGLGISKREFFFEQTPEANIALMNAVKRAFDPKGILNANISYVR